MRVRCEHRIPLDADSFFATMHSEAFEARVAEALGLTEYRVIEREEEAREIYRRIQVTPRLPAALVPILKRVAGATTASYVEEQWRSREERLVRWRMTPTVLRDRSHLEGTVRVVPAGPRACKRVLDGVVEVRVLGVGALLERAIVSQVEEAYGASAHVAAEMADELRAAASPSPRAGRA